MDHISRKKRSWNMSRIRSQNTKPEMTVRKFLHKQGFRYRIHYNIAGKPDIVFPKRKIAVFVHGCFWHHHECKYSAIPKTNTAYWNQKLQYNIERDEKTKKSLQVQGWKVKYIWECQIKNQTETALKKLADYLNKQLKP